MVKIHTGTSLLGHAVEAPQTPDEATLERVPNPIRAELHRSLHRAGIHFALFRSPVSRICTLVIDYLPGSGLVELKSSNSI